MRKNKKYLALVVSLFIVFSAIGQNLLQASWKFLKGDDPSYAQPGYDDASWKKIKVGECIEAQGMSDFSGIGWYRCTIDIPSQNNEMVKKYGGYTLYLATIDDADQTYFNGKLIGSMGTFPPKPVTAWDKLRVYTIPYDIVQWDKPNCIAVRIFDDAGNAGIIGEQVALTVSTLADSIQIKPEFQSPDHIILNQNIVTIPITIDNRSDELIDGQLTIKIKNEFKTEVLSQSQKVSIKGKSNTKMSFELKGLVPGFYQTNVAIECPITFKMSVFRFGLDPEKVTDHPNDSPANLKEFWDKAKHDLALVKPEYKLTHLDTCSNGAKDVYLLEMRSLGNVLIRGWYLVPKTKGPHPAILTVQGYSTYQQYTWTLPDDHFANLVLNIRGHGNSRDEINPGFPGFLTYGLEDKNTYIYRGAYMDCVRAVDFLFSRPEIDTTRVVVEGSSQGGALSFATAALNNTRIRLCVPEVPFLSDFQHYFKVADWPANEFTEYVNAHPQFGWDGVFGVLKYFDIKNLAPWVKAPVFMPVGLMDVTCPNHINFAAFNNLTVPREYKVYPYNGHGLPRENGLVKINWIQKQLGMKE
jgi:cephalosporin-C deacetylase